MRERRLDEIRRVLSSRAKRARAVRKYSQADRRLRGECKFHDKRENITFFFFFLLQKKLAREGAVHFANF